LVICIGGGKINIIDDPIAERVKSIIQPSVEGLQNKFDSDHMSSTYYKIILFKKLLFLGQEFKNKNQ